MPKIRRVGYALGAEVTGVDLRTTADDQTIADIREALLEHIVLRFPGQALEREHLLALSQRFGVLDDVSTSIRYDPNNPGIMQVTNKPIMVNGKPAGSYGGTDFWHSDVSFSESPNTFTFLCNKELPDVGGDTMFANCYMAYETLSPAFKEMIEPLLAVHEYTVGGSARDLPGQRAKVARLNPPVIHHLVRAHPETGRKALFIGQRVCCIDGMTREESKPLLAFLNQHATRYEFIYRHRWTVDDLLVWDNRCSMHFAVQDYDQSQNRRMLRCSLKGPRTGFPYTGHEVSKPAEPVLAAAR